MHKKAQIPTIEPDTVLDRFVCVPQAKLQIIRFKSKGFFSLPFSRIEVWCGAFLLFDFDYIEFPDAS